MPSKLRIIKLDRNIRRHDDSVLGSQYILLAFIHRRRSYGSPAVLGRRKCLGVIALGFAHPVQGIVLSACAVICAAEDLSEAPDEDWSDDGYTADDEDDPHLESSKRLLVSHPLLKSCACIDILMRKKNIRSPDV